MYRKDVRAYFGTFGKAADFLNITKQAVSQWPDPIPVHCALRLDLLTEGNLPFQKEIYQSEVVPRSSGVSSPSSEGHFYWEGWP